ncbi:uncharacterized protein LOC128888436 [Hylaeus anthracinus]|uniref:uncharacterized protein LOC128888436 n=1 Tax=Hylaeus anthracinus TaxID=313031 RepID=UPI0023B88B42|nr:uncharacterized protein LOC128888436 [Hylaeus anthracinus]
MELRSYFKADKCMLKSNIGKEYIYKYNNDFSWNSRFDDRIEPTQRKCSILVYFVKLLDTGNWTITDYYNQSVSQTFTVYIEQEVQVIPNTPIIVVEGNFVYVELDADLENLTSC